MKNKKYHTVGTFKKSNRKSIEANSIPLTHMHDRSLSGDFRVSIYCDHHVRLTLLHLLGMNRITFCIRTCGIICHSCCNAWPSRSNDSCGGWWTRLSSSSQRCSIWFQSGDFEDHGNTLMLFWVRKSTVSIAIWGRALSCWRIALCRSIALHVWLQDIVSITLSH